MFDFQYSQKEDKYEEEIRVLTDKLKEVIFISLFTRHFSSTVLLFVLLTDTVLILYMSDCITHVALGFVF